MGDDGEITGAQYALDRLVERVVAHARHELDQHVLRAGQRRHAAISEHAAGHVRVKYLRAEGNAQVHALAFAGGAQLAQHVASLCAAPSHYAPLYTPDLPLRKKIETIVREIYRGDGVDFAPNALKQLRRLEKLGFGALPVCLAKTQYSFSDDAKKLGAPTGFRITVRSIKLCAGAGFVVALTGDIMTMPGLPKVPAAESIDVDENGVISGLF